ncbi:hypothetical protein [Namhaeicola litoreus]|uniref:DUF4440 domain-containing protein n=1 Tax=Namhaeicola litoreus TaxID=1052145 RepID=A0ABW3XZN6_9FLAO
MKIKYLVLFFIMVGTQWLQAQISAEEKDIIELSKNKWQWMADKNVDQLTKLFHENAMFVHM